MTKPLRRIRLPPEAQAWEKRLQIRRWIDGTGWDAELRYALIEGVRGIWLEQGHEDLADAPEVIAVGMLPYMLKDAEFQRFVIYDAKQTLTDEADWEGATSAYAWIVLQKYNRELGGQDD
jgi:hypothetical protein